MRLTPLLGLALAPFLHLGAGCAEPPARPPRAQPPQLDVPFVRAHDRVVDMMLDTAGVTADDVLYDLGCGDGRIVITAALRRGARGVGVDLDPLRVAESRENARRTGVTARVRFLEQDLFATDVREATVVALYLLPEVNLKLRPKLLAELRPGARVVSHQYDMGEWRPDRAVEMGGLTVHLWVIPARADGRWTVRVEGAGPPQQGELTLAQQFQEVSGSARLDGAEVRLEDVALRGAALSFTAPGPGGALRFQGRIDGDTLHGTATPADGHGPARPWTATRQADAGERPR